MDSFAWIAAINRSDNYHEIFFRNECPLMVGVVAVIIGGVGSISGIALGALVLGMAQQFGVWKIGSQWQDAIAFVVLLIFLVSRPQGFLGKKVKKVAL